MVLQRRNGSPARSPGRSCAIARSPRPFEHLPLNPPPRADPQAPCLVPRVLQAHPPQPPDIPERPRTPPEVRNLLSNFEHHPSIEPLPAVRPTCARQPGALLEDALSTESSADIHVPLLDAVEFVFSTTTVMEPRSLAEALKRPDAAEWVKAALSEIEAHVQNGTWELAQLPPGRRAIGSRWVFKVKKTPDGAIDKYKGRLVAQGFSLIPGVYYGEVFASTARLQWYGRSWRWPRRWIWSWRRWTSRWPS